MFSDHQSDWQPASTPQPRGSDQRPPQRRGGRLAATIISVALVGGLIGVAADRWAINTFGPNPLNVSIPTVTTGPRIGPIAAPDGSRTTAQSAPTPPTAAATDPTQQAIQQVIQKGDEEQAQALAGNDPSVMQDTSTSDFYQSQVSANQDLQNNGVSDIKLVNIDWGQISVNGTSATATAFETWTTSYSDGTTEQSRDRNVYTLVQQNGRWVISADDHPDDNIGQGAPGATQPGSPGASQPGGTTPGQGRGNPGTGRGRGNPGGTQPTQPRVPSQDVSQNWSGYAATGGSFTAVSGTWTVPQFAPNSQAGADATWVGIGGVNTRDLIQAGTQQTVSGTGSTQYQAWVETLPQASHPVPLTVNPGDSVSISIAESPQAQDQWQVAYTNNTTGQTYQVTENYTSSLSSAEWIEEAPTAARGRQLPLDSFGSINFSQGSTVKDGRSVDIADAGAQPITMMARGTGQTAHPSSLGADGGSFTVTQG